MAEANFCLTVTKKWGGVSGYLVGWRLYLRYETIENLRTQLPLPGAIRWWFHTERGSQDVLYKDHSSRPAQQSY
jgi:hypothetical protein